MARARPCAKRRPGSDRRWFCWRFSCCRVAGWPGFRPGRCFRKRLMNLIEKAALRLEQSSNDEPSPIPVGPHAVPLMPLPQRRPSPNVTLDLERLQRLGYLVPSMDRSPLADEFRHIKRMLLKNVEGGIAGATARNSLIMVTSAVEGEGKTFCAINLAMSMAMEVDTSVLLVDADVMRPSISPRLGINSERGLLDLLT